MDDFPRLAALGRPDNPPLFHLLHQARGPVVAHLEPALEVRGGGLALRDHDVEGLLEQRVVAGLPLEVSRLLVIEEDLLIDVLGRAQLLHVLGDGVDLLIVDVRPLDARREGVPGGGEEHVALAKELLRAHRVDDDAGVELVRHHESDARGDVGLDRDR